MKRTIFALLISATAMHSCALSESNKKINMDVNVDEEVDAIADEVEAAAAFVDDNNADVDDNAVPGKSQVIDNIYKSAVLKADREYTIYLPPSYATQPDRRFPILYLLHGMLDDNRCWTRRAHLQAVADSLIAAGKMTEMIIVTPCAGGEANKDWNGYFDMPGWHYERFFMDEFMPFIEKTYRVKADRQHRAVAGLSMGGGAATSYSQRYPELFCGCYAMSALMDIVPLPGHKAGPKSMVGLFSKSVADLACPKFVRNADARTISTLKTIRWYVDCGDHDFLLEKNREFVAAMKQADIPLKVQYRPGKHSWQYWHSGLYIMLPFITECFGEE